MLPDFECHVIQHITPSTVNLYYVHFVYDQKNSAVVFCYKSLCRLSVFRKITLVLVDRPFGILN